MVNVFTLRSIDTGHERELYWEDTTGERDIVRKFLRSTYACFLAIDRPHSLYSLRSVYT